MRGAVVLDRAGEHGDDAGLRAAEPCVPVPAVWRYVVEPAADVAAVEHLVELVDPDRPLAVLQELLVGQSE